MRYIILGTAGHIDHGKTSLIRALTGRETDNLDEEKRRGISINLGFTYFDLPSGNRVGIIDAPGHERFIKNMMSGAVGIDIVLMIIAADDGVMPQTMEHAEILTYMGVEESIIVITKCDLVEEEFLDLVEDDIKSSLQNTILENSPIVKVDSISKRGLDELIKLIDDKTKKLSSIEVELMPTRLNVDRSFSLAGIGTVVTGTLIEGEVEVGKNYQLYPSLKDIRIRSIEVHETSVNKATKGQRTALNISNLDKNEIGRGNIIAKHNSLIESQIIDAKISLSNYTDIVLEHWNRVRVFHGTTEVLARIVPLDTKIIKKGDEAIVQLRLEEPIYCKLNDKFVLRSYSPVNTIGGGIVLETASKKHSPKDTEYIQKLEAKEKFQLKDMIYEFISRVNFGTTFEEIFSYTGQLNSEINKVLNDLINENRIILINDFYFADSSISILNKQLENILKEFHKNNPLEQGIPKEELRNKVAKKTNPKVFNLLLSSNSFSNLIENHPNHVSLKSFQVNLSEQNSKVADEILKKIIDAEPALLKDTDFGNNKIEKETLTFLLKDKLIRIDGFLIRKEKYNEIKENLISYLKDNNEITIAEFRDMNNFNRKMALALLEDFDFKKITKRFEEKRILY
ncbi:MAG: selenocysteine-specific translation elongation factor [Tissierellia bacterium]|nr:selenocysteine-specific translation elongation factor [Tissierellia bacterium]